jgi:surface antigen
MNTKAAPRRQSSVRTPVIAAVVLSLSVAGLLLARPADAAVIITGSSWLQGQGVDVCFNATDPCPGVTPDDGPSAAPWQCTDLVQRLYRKLGWYTGTFDIGPAAAMYEWAPKHGLEQHPNDGSYAPVPGDVVVHSPNDGGTTEAGHVAVVDTVQADSFTVREQNGSSSGGATYVIASGQWRRKGVATTPKGFVHAPKNHFGRGATGPATGYWMVGSSGIVYNFGDAAWYGDAPVGGATAEDLEPTPSGKGYWVVDSTGNVFAFGDARYFGGTSGLLPNERVTSISATPAGDGYWLFTTLGRVLTFGAALHYGDMAGTQLNGPVLDSIPTPSGRGYYMVASDGGIFTFGDAVFRGSMGGTRLNAPVQSLVPRGDGLGYWLVASDGGLFAFDAPFFGSMGSTRLNKPITGMVAFGSAGYMMVGEDGGIFTFGTAAFRGSLGDRPPANPITSVAVL